MPGLNQLLETLRLVFGIGGQTVRAARQRLGVSGLRVADARQQVPAKQRGGNDLFTPYFC
jgi:hypothetical protein